MMDCSGTRLVLCNEREIYLHIAAAEVLRLDFRVVGIVVAPPQPEQRNIRMLVGVEHPVVARAQPADLVLADVLQHLLDLRVGRGILAQQGDLLQDLLGLPGRQGQHLGQEGGLRGGQPCRRAHRRPL